MGVCPGACQGVGWGIWLGCGRGRGYVLGVRGGCIKERGCESGAHDRHRVG